MHNAKVTGDELKSFYTARAQIEEEYARKLLNLARKPLGSSEQGTLRMSLDVVRGEVESMGKQHQSVASQMKTELEEPLAAFTGGIKERRKIVQNGVEKLHKTKSQQTMVATKARDRFEQDCLKIKGYLAQGHMVMGQEERKNKAKLEKTQIQMSTNSNEYEAAVKVVEETTGKWNREWKAACDKFQDLEEERIDFFKSSLWSFANIASTVCVSDDQSCEKIRLSLEDCEVEKDITTFIKDCGTGQEIPDPPRYINFCRGDVDDAASVRSDEEYSVAQFQRSGNPAFRTSSPQPPSQDLDDSIQDENFDPRSSTGSANMPDLSRMHLGAPSERSSQASPTRPTSSGSLQHSDYTNPTSVSDVEDRAYNGSDFSRQHSASNVSSVSTPKQYQPSVNPLQSNTPSAAPRSFGHSSSQSVSGVNEDKKKGFFGSHSPFRRRSQKQLNSAVSSTSASANTSPVKPFGSNGRSNTWQAPDHDVDPRADYQLGIGNNVFDVANPSRPPKSDMGRDPAQDPIAQALAELKGVTKQSTMRTSADRHYGMATPGPEARVPAPFANVANGRTPPPAYDQPASRLGAPQPAHTSREMQKTTERYVNQARGVFTGRPTSPMPMRSTSPAPRASSPNPYNTNHGYNGQAGRQSAGGYAPRAASPNPAYARSSSRPVSRDNGMALQLAPEQQQQQRMGRPQSSYYGNEHGGSQALATRTRSQSQGTQRRFTKDGRQILHYCKCTSCTVTLNRHFADLWNPARAMYMYQAAIPEELSFAKGDILAVLRLQDDGWWEAEIVGKNGRAGLVPSNYLKNC